MPNRCAIEVYNFKNLVEIPLSGIILLVEQYLVNLWKYFIQQTNMGHRNFNGKVDDNGDRTIFT